jgi:hypothetical protein
MESVLAAWYLGEAGRATQPSALDEALLKAHTLNPQATFSWLAERCLDGNHFFDAVRCFLRASRCESWSPKDGYRVGEYILRHGSHEEATEYFNRILAKDSQDDFARYILSCYAYFNDLVQRVGDRVCEADQQSAATPRLLIQVVFWGAKYTEILLRYLLAALSAPRNIPLISKAYQTHFIFFSDREGAARLTRHPAYPELKKHVLPHVIVFPEALVKYATEFSNRHKGAWTIPPTLLTNAAHYAVIECGRLQNCTILNLCPDHLISDRFMAALIEILAEPAGVIAGPGFRLFFEKALITEIENRYRKQHGGFEVSPQEMTGLLMRHLPDPNFVNSPHFSSFPIYLCWKVAHQGIIAHVNHYHPWVVKGGYLDGPVQLSLDPIDGYFINRKLRDRKSIVFAPRAMMSFDLGFNPLCTPSAQNCFDPRKVAAWLKPYLTPVHENYFLNTLSYRLDEDTPSSFWHLTVEQASQVAREIVAHVRSI